MKTTTGLDKYLTEDEPVHSLPNLSDYLPSLKSQKIRERMRPLLSQPGVVFAVIEQPYRGQVRTYIAFNPCPKCGETPVSIERYHNISQMPSNMVGMTSNHYVYPCCPEAWTKSLEPVPPGNLRLQSKPATDLFQDWTAHNLYRLSIIPPKNSSAFVITGV